MSKHVFVDRSGGLTHFESCRTKRRSTSLPVETTVLPLESRFTKKEGKRSGSLACHRTRGFPTRRPRSRHLCDLRRVPNRTTRQDRAPGPPVFIGIVPTSTRTTSGTSLILASSCSRIPSRGRRVEGGKGGRRSLAGQGTTRSFTTRLTSPLGHYRGPKHQSLFSVKSQNSGIWSLGDEFINLLAGTTHVSARR